MYSIVLSAVGHSWENINFLIYLRYFLVLFHFCHFKFTFSFVQCVTLIFYACILYVGGGGGIHHHYFVIIS
jgi:hypothetical protein